MKGTCTLHGVLVCTTPSVKQSTLIWGHRTDGRADVQPQPIIGHKERTRSSEWSSLVHQSATPPSPLADLSTLIFLFPPVPNLHRIAHWMFVPEPAHHHRAGVNNTLRPIPILDTLEKSDMPSSETERPAIGPGSIPVSIQADQIERMLNLQDPRNAIS